MTVDSLQMRLDEAVRQCRAHPEDEANLYDLVDLLLQIDKIEVAQELLLSLEPLHGQRSGYHERLGRIALFKNDMKTASRHFAKAVELGKENWSALRLLGLSCYGCGDYFGAVTALRAYSAVDSSDAEAENRLGVASIHIGLIEEGTAILRRALEKNPDHLAILTNLADALKIQGGWPESLELYRRALEIDPHNGQAHVGLMSVVKYTEWDHPDLVCARNVLETTQLSPHDEAGVRFALGKAYNDCHAYDAAFEQYRRGNALRKEMATAFSQQAYSLYFEQIRQQHTPTFLNHTPLVGSSSRRPVFIVGMYRSGTSLTEQIIASHPQAFGAGELLHLSQMSSGLSERFHLGSRYPEVIHDLTQPMVEQLASEYEAELIRLAGSEDYVRISDKMPHNYFYLGLVAKLFPDAYVIHCQRDPLDTCLSIYFQDFTATLNYTNDLDDLGAYYVSYAELMAYWHDHLNMKMHTVQYEEMVSNPEVESRKLIEFLDLPWDDACLHPHRKKRAVNTASHWQVRQKIHTASKKRWKNYEKHLEGLRARLGEGLSI